MSYGDQDYAKGMMIGHGSGRALSDAEMRGRLSPPNIVKQGRDALASARAAERARTCEEIEAALKAEAATIADGGILEGIGIALEAIARIKSAR